MVGNSILAKTNMRNVAFLAFAALVLALMCGMAPNTAHAATPAAFDYDGDEITFIAADGAGFGMFTRQDGTEVSYENGQIKVHYVPKNKTIYAGFYLNAGIDDGPWEGFSFTEFDSDGLMDFKLDTSFAGKAWPIAPVQRKDKTATTSSQYYLAIPTLEKMGIIVDCTVTFTDGYTEGPEGVLWTEVVPYGGSASAPDDPLREGFRFLGWSTSFDNVQSDLTVSALWGENDKIYHTVTFVDGFGGTIDTIKVEEGSSVTPPPNPEHSGYTFIEWEPATFENITADLKVTAKWLNDDEISLNAVREKIEAIPEFENNETVFKSLQGDTNNKAVAEAGNAYNAMKSDLRNDISPEEKLHLVRALILVLPSDPFDVTTDDGTPIKVADTAYGTLSEEQQKSLDAEKMVGGDRTYGRYLESAQWALDSLRSVNDVTLLKDGTYSTGFTSTSTRGKSTSARDTTLTVKSVTVKDGRVTATLECSGTSYQTLMLAGKKYENTQTKVGSKPQFEIPMNMNSTFHVSIKSKSATATTDAVAFEMTVKADEASMTPDPKQQDDSGDDNKGSGSGGDNKDGSGNSGGGSDLPLGPTNSGGTSGGTSAGGNAGNLSSLLRTNGSGSGSTSSGGALTDALSDKGTSTSATSKSNNTAGGRGSSVELASADTAAGIVPINLAPAVAGGTLLAASLGCLAFALRFVRRESPLA